MSLSPRAGAALAGSAVFLVSLALYVPTLLPDVGTWDTAEFQAIGPVLGIAHPTGYPTYTLLAWLASVALQPFGNEAYRADLLSALLMAGAAALLAVALAGVTRRPGVGLLAGLAFAVTPVAWGTAVRADAHALHVFLAALMLVLLVAWAQRVGDSAAHAARPLLAAALVFGLSLGNHALTLLLAPGIAAYVLLVAPRILWQQWRLVLACLGLLALASVVVYAYLPLRSGMDPPLDYADPETWERFWYVVLGEQFRGSFGPLPGPADMLSAAWDEMVRAFGLLAVFVPAGVVAGALRHPRLVVLTGLWLVCTWIFALGYPNAAIERYYLVPLLAAAAWIGLAADAAADAAADVVRMAAHRPARAWASRLLASALVLALVVVALAPLPDRSRDVDASEETFAREWLEAVLATLEPGAAVVSWWSWSTPLWYGRWVEGRRDDILIIDDRDILDDGYGTAAAAVERLLPQRPTYVIRLERDLAALARRYVLERVPSVPGPGALYRVLGPREAE